VYDYDNDDVVDELCLQNILHCFYSLLFLPPNNLAANAPRGGRC